MSKKNRRDRQERGKPFQPEQGKPAPSGTPAGQPPGAAPQPPAPVQPGAPEGPSGVDPKYLTWSWYGKIFLGCFVLTWIAFLGFVYIMKSISRGYTEDGIAMYRMAKSLQAQKERHPDIVTAELAALDAVVDIEKLKAFILSDVAYKEVVTEDTKAWLREQDEKYTELLDHLKQVKAFDPIQEKIRDKTVEKIQIIQDSVRTILKKADMSDRLAFRNTAIALDRTINQAAWYSQIAAGFFSWPAALDAAERSFFEALRFWQENPEAAYWWGRVLDETAIHDVAAEKKIMAVRFDPKSELADSIVVEFKTALDANPEAPRAIYNYAFALYRKGRVDEAVPLYRKVYEKDPQMETFEGFLAKRRLDIIERKIDMRWYKTDDF
ncbi:MAG: hypothetical protein A3G34_09990 [Candidatus Lindowbacteria bacterium RIFCSPLOWO2_12_FULL_62_27]|nr:MAG: hypothetical protein A3G34_09990 [Candidatus Lindowbacteria bacterium RIFCSPLOWO2_12_FULL_62_27]OGH61570.1 MAG: hypothetical protein A3I06_03000 [Candidatus Lindowbacteria bacterium RIFCSPLOWO2_02_FULL_62_12]